MAKARKSTSQGVVVSGEIEGKVRDIEVGPITGTITQTNSADQVAANIGTGSAPATINQASLQGNTVLVEGDASLDIAINGRFKGQIRDVEVGLITGDVTQTNVVAQGAGNLSAGGGNLSPAIDQIALQGNFLAASGEVQVDMVFSGEFKGKVRDLEVGLITGDISQTNSAAQAAANLSAGGGGGTQAIGQAAAQANFIVAAGNINITLVFEGNFKGQVRDISIGVFTGDISQTNSALQVAMNVAATRDPVAQSLSQFITQTNSVGLDGDVDVTIRFDPGFEGDYRDIQIDLLVDRIVQSNSATQIAANIAVDPVWG